MRRRLLPSSAFVRAANRAIKRQPRAAEEIGIALELLAQDTFDPRLKTHKLKGPLRGSMACSAGFDLRILFRIVEHENSEAILLESVGTHEEVY